jgi:hypothetical protein
MAEIRDLRALDPKARHDCDRIHIQSFQMEEVILPILRKEENVKAIRVQIDGRNLKAVAQPLVVSIGKQTLQFLRIAPDENSVEGILLKEPKSGDSIVVQLGDQDGARHHQTVDVKAIKRIN